MLNRSLRPSPWRGLGGVGRSPGAATPAASATRKSDPAKDTGKSTVPAESTARASKRPKTQDPVRTVEAFVALAQKCDGPVLLGIDPGSTGAIGFLCGPHHAVVDIPTIRTKVKRTRKTRFKVWKKTGRRTKVTLCTVTTFDYARICGLFRLLKPVKDRVKVMLEKIPPTLGRGRKYAEIMLNRAYAMWPLFLHSKGYAVTETSPGVWKDDMKLLGKEKAVGRKMAIRLFPNAPLSRVKDHDRAEALLMAEYLRKQLAKKKTP